MALTLSTLGNWLFGKPKDPKKKGTYHSIVLIAFFAWIALGSDGLSSANYGPQAAFESLGNYTYLATYLAIMIAVTVFIIAAAYNQVIELFPNGGGGYKVANKLLHPYAGLVSGTALILDYILTIAISASAASDALFSLLPPSCEGLNIYCKLVFIMLLTLLNLRGMKESTKILMPIFLGFVITHLVLLGFGIISKHADFQQVWHNTQTQTSSIIAAGGFSTFLLIILKAYSLGAGTYTGLEAVSNNVNVLAEPRVRTGKWTMFYMALSLSVTAGGITFCYLLWHIHDVSGQTYNAALFGEMLGNDLLGHIFLIITLTFEAGILLLGANTGFLGGPAVLSNMAVDRWWPSFFGNLSSRLVRQNGVLFFGIGSLLIVAILDGHVDVLVILYSVSVFLTFSISLFALLRYWITHRSEKKWLPRLLLSVIGFIVCVSILIVTTLEKFLSGAWLTLLVAVLLIAFSLWLRRYYRYVNEYMKKQEELFSATYQDKNLPLLAVDPALPTAIIIVDEYRAVTLHTLLNMFKLFKGQFKQIVFLAAGLVDVTSFGGEGELEHLQKQTADELKFLTNYTAQLGFPATSYSDFGTNPATVLNTLIDEAKKVFKDCVFFSGHPITNKHEFINRLLDNSVAITIQNKLHHEGTTFIILPMTMPGVT